MAKEIERKFLTTGEQWRAATPIYYCQGYLNRDKQRTVRVRIAGDKAMLTVKGLTTGASRDEFEYDIPIDDAKSMLAMCEQPLIEKNRRIVHHEGLDWDVDEFLGLNEGLIVAEVELESENQVFQTPKWVGDEVTNDPRYFNSSLSSKPFTKW